MVFLLWAIAVVLVIAGIWRIVVGDFLWGIVLIVVGLLVGPGGVSIFDFDDDDAGAAIELTL
jgi:TM2 domain-containing membrane protein YozV